MVFPNASDRDERSRCGEAYGGGQRLEPACIEFGFLRRRSEDGPEGDVIYGFSLGGFEFFQRMSRATDHKSLSHIVGNRRRRYVRLPEVDGVGLCKQCDVVAVIQDETRTRLVGQRPDRSCPFETLAIAGIFGAQLDDGNAGRAGVACLLDGTATPTWIVVGQYVKSQIVAAPIVDGGLL